MEGRSVSVLVSTISGVVDDWEKSTGGPHPSAALDPSKCDRPSCNFLWLAVRVLLGCRQTKEKAFPRVWNLLEERHKNILPLHCGGARLELLSKNAIPLRPSIPQIFPEGRNKTNHTLWKSLEWKRRGRMVSWQWEGGTCKDGTESPPEETPHGSLHCKVQRIASLGGSLVA